jgi:DNA-binding transcriptional ArsR family regulator
MVTEEERPVRQPIVTAAASLPSDLSWLLCMAARPTLQARYPLLAEMFNGRERLVDAVRNFWDDFSGELGFTEMQILAHHGGASTETDPGRLWLALERAVPTVPPDFEIRSESPEERAIFLNRIRRLRESPALLESYLALLQEVWEPVDDMWQEALPIIEEAGRHLVAQFERGRSLDLLIPVGCDILAAQRPRIVSDVYAGQLQLLFVPCLFFGTSMYLEFPGLVVIGSGVSQGDVEARARTESVAKRLKAVADPTRLALLHSLASAPSTVGELAALFRLSQPTVSMHVKVLRQNGLVRSERIDGRLRLSADPSAVESLLADMREAVLHGTAPAPGAAPSARP